MTHEEKNVFIHQVAAVIQQQQANEDYPYFHRFINECRRYDLTEDEFNMQIRTLAFTLYEGPVEPTSGPNCVLFGTKCFSVRKIGEMLFNFPAKSDEYLADPVLFKEDVRKLENSDRTLELLAVFKSEELPGRRYLRMVYHLNPALPYRVGQVQAGDIRQLLLKAFEDYSLYDQVASQFLNGNLHIWLEETDPERAVLAGAEREYGDFLRLIYRIDKSFPFYLGSELFLNPQELVSRAKEDFGFWNTFFQYMKNGQLMIWFAETGREEINQRYREALRGLANLDYYTNQEKKHAAIQSLINIIDAGTALPGIISTVNAVDLSDIEASRPLQHAVMLTLAHSGFVKGKVSFSEAIDGISCREEVITLNSYTGIVSAPLFLDVVPILLEKNKRYETDLRISSLAGSLIIPVRIKTVFPKKAYLFSIAKYAGIGLLFFSVIRLLLMGLMDSVGWVARCGNPFSCVPVDYGIYIVAMGCMLAGIAGTVYFIRKEEVI